jgi:hypothetical protein
MFQIEIEDLAALDCRLVSLFNGAILLLAEFLLLDSSEHTENSPSSKLRRAHSTSDGQCKLDYGYLMYKILLCYSEFTYQLAQCM